MSLSFEQPWGLVLLAALPAILWLHRRRRPTQPLQVPSLLPWLPFAVRRPPRRSRLEASALLLCHLLAATLVALSAAGLRWSGRGGPMALVLDASPSMAFGDRWRDARRALQQLTDARTGPFTLVLATDEPRLLTHRASDPGDLLAALADAQPLAPATLQRGPALREALDLARRLAPDDRPWLFADPDAGRGAYSSGPVHWMPVGDREPNRAIVAAFSRATRSGSELYLQVAGDTTLPLDLEVTREGNLLWRSGDGSVLQEVLGDPDSRIAVLALPGTGVAEGLRASLRGADRLASDDQREVHASEGRLLLQVLGAPPALVGELTALPGLQVTPLGRAESLPEGQARLSLLVGGGETDLPPGPLLRLGEPGSKRGAERLRWTDLPHWLPAAPPGDLYLRPAAAGAQPAPGDRVLGYLGDEAALWLSLDGGRPSVTLAVDPLAPEHRGGRGWLRLLRWSMEALLSLTPQGSPEAAIAVWARSEEAGVWSTTAPAAPSSAADPGPLFPAPWRLAAMAFVAACLAELLIRQPGSPLLPRPGAAVGRRST